MTLLKDIMDRDLLHSMIDQGFIRVQYHPDYPLSIFNYSEKAQINGVWNNATLQCRGLIINNETGEVVARPFPKFFNYGEAFAPTPDPDEPVVVTDKLDGSLGILYPLPDGSGHAIATRGSFTSNQAIHATKIWNEKYADEFEPSEGETVLFEIVYPENRLVVDYGEMDDLVLLGGVEIESGDQFPPHLYEDWPGHRAMTMPYVRIANALEAAPRANREGMVVHFLLSGARVKIKQEDYVRLHKIITGLNEKVVWEHLRTDGHVWNLVEKLPDEFHSWVFGIDGMLQDQFDRLHFDVLLAWITLDMERLTEDRKSFALAVKDKEAWVKACLFKKLDGKDYYDIIWKEIEPKNV